MTPEERLLLETTARSLLKLQRHIHDRVDGMEIVLREIFLSQGRTAIALARIRIWADLLELKGTPSAYLSSFIKDFSARPLAPEATRMPRALTTSSEAEAACGRPFETAAFPLLLISAQHLSRYLVSMRAFLKATGADMRHGGDRAYYNQTHNHVQLPELGTFIGPD